MLPSGYLSWSSNSRCSVSIPRFPFEVYLFDGTGEPLGETRLVLGDETERTFNTTDVVFDIPRDFEIEDDQLLIMSRRANHQLGRISVEELSREASADLLSFQENLSLGIHYSECVDDTCQQRRDPNRAVIHLLAALTTDEDRENDHESAARQLFYLQNELQTCEAFGTLTSEIEMHRPNPYRYTEMADSYLAMALYLRELSPDDRQAARELALQNMLWFLSWPQEETDLFRRVNMEAIELSVLLFGNKHPVTVALLSNNRQQLEEVRDDIRATFPCTDSNR